MILLIFTCYMDKKDKKRNMIKLLADNQSDDVYFYEIIFYTGSRPFSETDSNVSLNYLFTLELFYVKIYLKFFKVKVKIFGENFDSRTLNINSNEKIKNFRRSGIDSFVMSCFK